MILTTAFCLMMTIKICDNNVCSLADEYISEIFFIKMLSAILVFLLIIILHPAFLFNCVSIIRIE